MFHKDEDYDGTDFLGQPLREGARVVFSYGKSTSLIWGTIKSVSSKGTRVYLKEGGWKAPKHIIQLDPDQVAQLVLEGGFNNGGRR